MENDCSGRLSPQNNRKGLNKQALYQRAHLKLRKSKMENLIETPKLEINPAKVGSAFHEPFKVPAKEVTLHDFQIEKLVFLTEANIESLRTRFTDTVTAKIADDLEDDLNFFKSTVKRMAVLKGGTAHV